MGIFQQLYSLKVDETTHKNSAVVDVEILQGDKSVFQSKQTSEELNQTGEQMTLEKILPADTLAPGKYKLQIRVTDTLANQTVSSTEDFTVTAAETAPAAARSSSGR
jgi:5-hydroxyisourate hydrolase-like protein (transthyretin family)